MSPPTSDVVRITEPEVSAIVSGSELMDTIAETSGSVIRTTSEVGGDIGRGSNHRARGFGDRIHQLAAGLARAAQGADDDALGCRAEITADLGHSMDHAADHSGN